jgi:hypothetical protein
VRGFQVALEKKKLQKNEVEIIEWKEELFLRERVKENPT